MSRIDEMAAKIRALLAKANCASTTEAEADAFMAKAHELMERYQLGMADVLTSGDPVVGSDGRTFSTGDFAWKRELYASLARLYGCQTVWCAGGSYRNGRWQHTTLKVVGRESATVTLDLMYPFVAAQVREAGYRMSRETRKSAASCMNSVGMALVIRVNRLWRAQLAEQQRAGTPEARNALVVVDQVKARMHELFPDMTTGKARPISSTQRATEHAAGIGLDRQVGAGSTLMIGRK